MAAPGICVFCPESPELNVFAYPPGSEQNAKRAPGAGNAPAALPGGPPGPASPAAPVSLVPALASTSTGARNRKPLIVAVRRASARPAMS